LKTRRAGCRDRAILSNAALAQFQVDRLLLGIRSDEGFHGDARVRDPPWRSQPRRGAALRFDLRICVRVAGICTGKQINANVERPKLLLKQVIIFMGFIHGALVNEPHQMGVLDSTGTARVARHREHGRANSAPKAQSIPGESNRLRLGSASCRTQCVPPDKAMTSRRRAGPVRC
jgi:hypothetical protein